MASIETHPRLCALQRLEQLTRYVLATANLGSRTRAELGRMARIYSDEHRLALPLELIGHIVLLVLAEPTRP